MGMTRDDVYRALERLHDMTDWNNLESIKRYNEQNRYLHQMLAREEERRKENGKTEQSDK